MTDLSSLIHAPQDGRRPEQLVVLIHGLGADGADLIELAPMLARHLPAAVFVAPDGPFPCDMAPFGRQWFSLQSRTQAAMSSGITAAAPILASFIQAQLDRLGLPATALALVGFSQGAMMALHVGLRMDPAPAAVVGLSGRLVDVAAMPEEVHGKPPVLLIHGDADDVVPFSSMAAAEAALKSQGVPVKCLVRRGLGHGIDPGGIERTGVFLAGHLSGSHRPG